MKAIFVCVLVVALAASAMALSADANAVPQVDDGRALKSVNAALVKQATYPHQWESHDQRKMDYHLLKAAQNAFHSKADKVLPDGKIVVNPPKTKIPAQLPAQAIDADIIAPGNNAHYVKFGPKLNADSFSMTFWARASNDVHVSFMNGDKQDRSDDAIEVVIGGWGNQRSVIRHGTQGKELAVDNKADRVSKTNWRLFWVKVTEGVLFVGEYQMNRRTFLSAKVPLKAKSLQVAFGGWDSAVYFSKIYVLNGLFQNVISDPNAEGKPLERTVAWKPKNTNTKGRKGGKKLLGGKGGKRRMGGSGALKGFKRLAIAKTGNKKLDKKVAAIKKVNIRMQRVTLKLKATKKSLRATAKLVKKFDSHTKQVLKTGKGPTQRKLLSKAKLAKLQKLAAQLRKLKLKVAKLRLNVVAVGKQVKKANKSVKKAVSVVKKVVARVNGPRGKKPAKLVAAVKAATNKLKTAQKAAKAARAKVTKARAAVLAAKKLVSKSYKKLLAAKKGTDKKAVKAASKAHAIAVKKLKTASSTHKLAKKAAQKAKKLVKKHKAKVSKSKVALARAPLVFVTTKQRQGAVKKAMKKLTVAKAALKKAKAVVAKHKARLAKAVASHEDAEAAHVEAQIGGNASKIQVAAKKLAALSAKVKKLRAQVAKAKAIVVRHTAAIRKATKALAKAQVALKKGDKKPLGPHGVLKIALKRRNAVKKAHHAAKTEHKSARKAHQRAKAEVAALEDEHLTAKMMGDRIAIQTAQNNLAEARKNLKTVTKQVKAALAAVKSTKTALVKLNKVVKVAEKKAAHHKKTAPAVRAATLKMVSKAITQAKAKVVAVEGKVKKVTAAVKQVGGSVKKTVVQIKRIAPPRVKAVPMEVKNPFKFATATASGDPHTDTFDGLHHDTMVQGWFSWVDSDIFKIQSYSQLGCMPAGVPNTCLRAHTIQITPPNSSEKLVVSYGLWHKGTPEERQQNVVIEDSTGKLVNSRTFQSGIFLNGKYRITKSGSRLTLQPAGASAGDPALAVSVSIDLFYLTVTLPKTSHYLGKTNGMMGHFTGKRDFASVYRMRDGSPSGISQKQFPRVGGFIAYYRAQNGPLVGKWAASHVVTEADGANPPIVVSGAKKFAKMKKTNAYLLEVDASSPVRRAPAFSPFPKATVPKIFKIVVKKPSAKKTRFCKKLLKKIVKKGSNTAKKQYLSCMMDADSPVVAKANAKALVQARKNQKRSTKALTKLTRQAAMVKCDHPDPEVRMRCHLLKAASHAFREIAEHKRHQYHRQQRPHSFVEME